MKQLLAIDMDGTCLNSRHRISEQNMKALQAAADAGILIVPTTGRSLSCLPEQLENAPFFRYVISSNGADVIDLQTKTSLYQAMISQEEALRLLRGGQQHRLGLSIHAGHEFFVQGVPLNLLGRLTFGREARKARYSKNLAEMLEQNPMQVEEIQFFFFSKTKQNDARRLFSDADQLTAAYSSCYVEAYSQNASKGKALAALASHLGIAKENIACIGDEENDLSMFETAGTKFAMGNAIQPLKDKADIVLPTNDESGVAAAISQLISWRKSR